MKAFYLTDKGNIRDHNEDSVTIVKNESNEYLMVVADGMGGHRAGEVASSIAVTHLGKKFSESSSIGSKSDAVNWLNENIEEINAKVLEYANEHFDSIGMGTTIVLALLTKEFLLFGNVGDSSGFILKGDKLHKVTKDHTLVNLLVDAGDLTEEEAAFHPKKNVLMKAIGAAEKIEIDKFDVLDFDGADAILLCSDGLTNMLTKQQIENVLTDKELSIEEQISKLVRKSNARGGTDNISIAYLVRNEGCEK